MGHDVVGRKVQEREAVRTTIVGGRPPGSGQSVGRVPRGVEVLLKKAAVDEAFKQRLLDQRGAVAAEIGLELTAGEEMLLKCVKSEQLDGMVGRTKVPTHQIAVFLGRVAAAMLATIGVMVAGCGEDAAPPTKVGATTQTGGATTGAAAQGVRMKTVWQEVDGAGKVIGQYDSDPTTQPIEQPMVMQGVRPMGRIVKVEVPETGPLKMKTVWQKVDAKGKVVQQFDSDPGEMLQAGVLPGRVIRVEVPDTAPAASQPTSGPGAAGPRDDGAWGLQVVDGIRPLRPEGVMKVAGERADVPGATQPERMTMIKAKDVPDVIVIAGLVVERFTDTAPGTQATQPATTRALKTKTVWRELDGEGKVIGQWDYDPTAVQEPVVAVAGAMAMRVRRIIKVEVPVEEPATQTQPAATQAATEPVVPQELRAVNGIRVDRP